MYSHRILNEKEYKKYFKMQFIKLVFVIDVFIYFRQKRKCEHLKISQAWSEISGKIIFVRKKLVFKENKTEFYK